MHKTFFTGKVTKNGAELRNTQNGDKVLGFSVAVSNGKDKNGEYRDSTFFDCSLWGKRAEALANHITPETILSIVGRVSAREYSGKAYLQISVDELSFVGGGVKPDQQGGAPERGPGSAQTSIDLDDEIPF